MRFVRLDPPGSICQYQAIYDMLSTLAPRTFIEVGCGAGDLSKRLVDRGMNGVGIDYSASALEIARVNLAKYIESGQFQLRLGDLAELDESDSFFDMAVSMMVMEHIEDDRQFLDQVCGLIKPGGHLLLGVPARMDRWSIEDETAGHYRRYEKHELQNLLLEKGLEDIEIWSVGVPVSNWLFGLSNFFISRSAETQKRTLSKKNQTETSGIREIPFKTIFPPVFKLLLNRYTLSPIWLLQRVFYNTDRGLTLLARATRPIKGIQN